MPTSSPCRLMMLSKVDHKMKKQLNYKSLLKEYLPLLIAYILLQIFAFVIGFILMNSWRPIEKWIPINKWPDWYMCLLSIPVVYYMIGFKVRNDAGDDL